MDSDLNKILQKLKSYDIVIKSVDEQKKVIFADGFVVILDDNESILVSFEIGMLPEEVAIAILILKEIRKYAGKYKLKIAQSFYLGNDGSCVYGEDAVKMRDNDKKKKIIGLYLKDKFHENILLEDKYCFHC